MDVTGGASGPAGLTGTVTPAVNLSSGTSVAWNATVVGSSAVTHGAVVEWLLGTAAFAFGPNVTETYYDSVDPLSGNMLYATALVNSAHNALLRGVPIPLPGFFATESGGFVPEANALQLTTQLTGTGGVVPLVVSAQAFPTGPGTVAVGWAFGDGATGRGTSVSHVYVAEGDFTVTARAYDAYGDLAIRVGGVVASVALALDGCAAVPLHGTVPYTVTLDPSPLGGEGPPYSYNWTLPDGANSTASSVSVTFDRPGEYRVLVEVTDSGIGRAVCLWEVDVSAPLPVTPAEVVLLGLGVGVALAVFFVWVTRPRPGT